MVKICTKQSQSKLNPAMGPKKSNFNIGFIARVSSGLDIFKVEKNLF